MTAKPVRTLGACMVVTSAVRSLAGALAVGTLLTGCADGTAPSTALLSGSTPPAQTSVPAPTASTSKPAATTSAPSASDRGLVEVGYQGRYRAVGTVLEAAGKAPELCLGSLLAALPSQCGGLPLIGWSWDATAHEETGGTRWGSYVVVGRYDGTSFTLTQPATARGTDDPQPADSPRLDTPCRPPTGGWASPNPARATEAAFGSASGLARHQRGYGALWIDQRRAMDDGSMPGATAIANDPAHFVVNVTTTGDVAAMERVLRTVWGGSLCVSRAPRTAADMSRTRNGLVATPSLVSLSSDDRAGQILLTVVHATTELRRDLDRRFGTGAVRLTGALQPID